MEVEEKLYNELGHITMRIGEQAQVCNRENAKLQALHKAANEKATEIEECQKK